MLSAVGHNPTFAVRRFEGDVHFNPDKPAGSLTLRMAADSLAVQGEMSDKDRREIEQVTKDEVLEVSKHPDIVYACPETSVRKIGEGQFEVTLPGSLSLHGVTLRQLVSARISLASSIRNDFTPFLFPSSASRLLFELFLLPITIKTSSPSSASRRTAFCRFCVA